MAKYGNVLADNAYEVGGVPARVIKKQQLFCNKNNTKFI
jgi:hypothetical protein